MTKIILFSKDCWARSHYLLCERQGLYHCATGTQLTKNSCFSDLSDSLNSLNSVKVVFYLGETPFNLYWLENKSILNVLHIHVGVWHHSSVKSPLQIRTFWIVAINLMAASVNNRWLMAEPSCYQHSNTQNQNEPINMDSFHRNLSGPNAYSTKRPLLQMTLFGFRCI